MAARKPGRYLAPIALVAIGVAIALLVKDQLATTSHSSTTAGGPSGALVQSTRGLHHKRHRRKFYTVKSGDTLSGISVKTGIPVPIIETLNPGLNPNALQTGQRLRLRR